MVNTVVSRSLTFSAPGTNVGNIVINSFTFSSFGSKFTVSSGSVTLAPGASSSITLQYVSSVSGNHNSTLTCLATSEGVSQNVTINANSIATIKRVVGNFANHRYTGKIWHYVTAYVDGYSDLQEVENISCQFLSAKIKQEVDPDSYDLVTGGIEVQVTQIKGKLDIFRMANFYEVNYDLQFGSGYQLGLASLGHLYITVTRFSPSKTWVWRIKRDNYSMDVGPVNSAITLRFTDGINEISGLKRRLPDDSDYTAYWPFRSGYQYRLTYVLEQAFAFCSDDQITPPHINWTHPWTFRSVIVPIGSGDFSKVFLYSVDDFQDGVSLVKAIAQSFNLVLYYLDKDTIEVRYREQNPSVAIDLTDRLINKKVTVNIHSRAFKGLFIPAMSSNQSLKYGIVYVSGGKADSLSKEINCRWYSFDPAGGYGASSNVSYEYSPGSMTSVDSVSSDGVTWKPIQKACGDLWWAWYSKNQLKIKTVLRTSFSSPIEINGFYSLTVETMTYKFRPYLIETDLFSFLDSIEFVTTNN